VPILFIFDIFLAAKAGPYYLGQMRCAYGLFFYLVLFVGLLSIYLLQEIKLSAYFAPFILVVVILVVLNSNWPYRTFAKSYGRDFLVYSLIDTFVEADIAEHTKIILYIPEWEGHEDWEIADCLTLMLYNHKITSNRIFVEKIIRGSDSVHYQEF
jgi:hypothetical protein